MKLFAGLFAAKSPLDKLRKIMAQKNYAEARILAAELLSGELDAAEKMEIEEIAQVAGDALARRNLEEARGFLNLNDVRQARDYLALALDLAVSQELMDEIASCEELAGQQGMATAPKPGARDTAPQATCEESAQLDLILTSYPESVRYRYHEKSAAFKEAFLSTHAGDDRHALTLWEGLADADRDDLYLFEVGALLGRCGELERSCALLSQATAINPELFIAVEALIAVLLEQQDFAQAEQKLTELLEHGANPRFCHAQLTLLKARQNDFPGAAAQARLALTVGNGDPSFLQLAAFVFEQNASFAEAELALHKIPGSGCCGGISLPLAEYWLRHKKELAKVLDVFNAACREEPDNPRWQLRAAQTYLARNWRKDAHKLLSKVVSDPRLEPELAREAAQQLALLQE